MATTRSPILDHCPTTLPAAAYTDAAWFERERRGIWQRGWIYAGRAADLPPGRMRPLTIGGAGVILGRMADGRLVAFHNTCRHRGAELCSAEAALGRTIRCPYHAWSYAAEDGRLLSTAFATPTSDFDPAGNGLFPVAVTTWNGFVFLNLAEDPEPLAPDLGLNAYDNWPMESLVTGHRVVRDLACNWKIFWENYNECLHCPGIHPELSDMVPVYREGIMAEEERPGWVPGTAPGHQLKAGAVTWTMDGRPCGEVFPDLSDAERATAANFVTVYPSMFVVAHVDYVRCVSLVPTGPETTRLTAEWLFPPRTLAQPGFDASDVAAFASIVLEQDARACEMNQRGLHSPRYEAGRLMPQEFALRDFHRWVLARLEEA